MDIATLAIWLTVFAVIGLGFLSYVLWKQIPLLGEPGTAVIKRVRYTLFIITLILFVANLIILAIDILTVFSLVKRSTNILNPIGIIYGLTIAIGFMASSAGWWFIYWTITRDNDAALRLATKNQQPKDEK